MNFRQIGKKLRIAFETVRRTIRVFEQRGYHFDRLSTKRQRFKIMTARLKRHLLSKSLLEHWAPYAIHERAKMMEELFGVSMSRAHLTRFYRQHGVSFLTAKLRYRYAQLNRPRLDAKRKQFALTLGNLIASRRSICYTDETTFNVQTAKRRSWALKSDPNHHHIESNR